MKRRLFNLAALLSLILCLGCLFMWVRSCFVYDYAFIPHGAPGAGTSFMSLHQQSSICVGRAMEKQPRLHWESYTINRRSPSNWLQLPAYSPSYNHFRLPYWFLTAANGTLPAVWWWKRRKEKRLRGGRGFEVSPATATPPQVVDRP